MQIYLCIFTWETVEEHLFMAIIYIKIIYDILKKVINFRLFIDKYNG